MDTSQLIAGLAGPLLAAIAVAMLVNPRARDAIMETAGNQGLIFFAGMLTLLAGLAIVRAHNLWVADWRVVVTVLGWLAVLGGVLRIILPDRIANIRTKLAGNSRFLSVWSLVALASGLFLSAKGYGLV
jgi:hypothetical protein